MSCKWAFVGDFGEIMMALFEQSLIDSPRGMFLNSRDAEPGRAMVKVRL